MEEFYDVWEDGTVDKYCEHIYCKPVDRTITSEGHHYEVKTLRNLKTLLCHYSAKHARTLDGGATNLPLNDDTFMLFCKALRDFDKSKEERKLKINKIETVLSWLLGCEVTFHEGDFVLSLAGEGLNYTFIYFSDALLFDISVIVDFYDAQNV